MGWKSIKHHYRIEHIVHVTDEGICIGSPYIHNLIVIDRHGRLVKRDRVTNDDIRRYIAEMDADPEKLRELALAEDAFGLSQTIYTFDGGEIVEKQAEAVGWPNPTNDGELQYDNTHFADKSDAARAAKREAAAGIELLTKRVAEISADLDEAKTRLREFEADAVKLDADHPGVDSDDADEAGYVAGPDGFLMSPTESK